ncbi:tape measure protein [Ochrobactrum sp. Marseille-Q0166]|uniref:tape measure protein n=1 Tax=Ochrobactrum sp. Marseille-Q0166 TaxID=2761105 RepID=UPI00165522B0|nr:tape measure protein [Ochrobactrum sp. Marseille-Q0166]MBC8718832.1 tape measure protein [Ochrobactrum sp. Marseille-Q0166]
MDDLATLGIKVSYADVQGAVAALDQLAERGPKVERAIEGIGKASRGATAEIGLLKTAAGALFGGLSVKLLMDTADAFSDISSRVNLAAGSVEKGGAVMDRLSEIARNTYSSLSQTAEGYLANASTMRELGYSTQQVLDYTSALNNAFVVSGAKGERAAQVQDALAKAMASGKLSGQDLNTVIERGGVVAELLAARFNTTQGGLRKLGAEGKLTGDVLVDTLLKAMLDLEQKAASMPATIADGFTLIGNSLLQVIGIYDQAGTVSESFAAGLIFVADNMEQIAIVGGTAAAVYGGVFVASMAAAFLATNGLTGAVELLRGALLKTLVGAFVVALGQMVYMLVKAREATGSWGAAFEVLGGRLNTLWEGVKEGFRGLTLYMESLWYGLMQKLYTSTDGVVKGMLRLFGIDAGTAEALGMQYAVMGETAGKYASDAFANSFQLFKDGMASFEMPTGDVVDLNDKLTRLNVASNDNDKAAKRLKKAWDDLLRTAKDRVAQMELEAQLVGKNAIEADVLRMKLEALQEAEKKGLKLKPEQIAQLDALADKYGELARKVAEYQLMEDAAFERQQMFRSPIDQRIAADLKQAGIEMDSAGGQAYATFVRTTEQIGIAKDAVRDFAGTFVSDLLQGKSALEALVNALSQLADKLISMALDQAINSLFGNLLGITGGSGFGMNFFPAAPSSGGIGLFAKGGISDRPAIFGEAGPEAAVPLPDGRSIPVTLSGPSSSANERGQGVHVTIGWAKGSDGNIAPIIKDVSQQTFKQGMQQYEKGGAVRTASNLRQVSMRGMAK